MKQEVTGGQMKFCAEKLNICSHYHAL